MEFNDLISIRYYKDISRGNVGVRRVVHIVAYNPCTEILYTYRPTDSLLYIYVNTSMIEICLMHELSGNVLQTSIWKSQMAERDQILKYLAIVFHSSYVS